MPIDGPFNPTPQKDALGQEPVDLISDGGRRALSIIRAAQGKLEPYVLTTHLLDWEYLHPIRMHMPPGNPITFDQKSFSPQLRFGYLDDLEKPSEITLMAVRQNYRIVNGMPEHITLENARLKYGREIYFGKSLAIELLSKVQPGKTVQVEGKGVIRKHSAIQSDDDEHAREQDLNYDIQREIDLILELTLSGDSRRVDFRYGQVKGGVFWSGEFTFEKGRFLRAPKYSHR